MQMVFWASSPMMAFADDDVPEVKPWGLITNGKGVPVNKPPFVFDDWMQDFGRYAFRFSNNGYITEANAAKIAKPGPIFPQINAGEYAPEANLTYIITIVVVAAVLYPWADRAVQNWKKTWTGEIRAGTTIDWVNGPKRFPIGKKVLYLDGEHPVKKLKYKNEKETKRVMDNIERQRVFWAAKEEEWEALRTARRERILEQQANGYNLPWDQIVVKEMEEKGPFWFFYNNRFYESVFKTDVQKRLAYGVPSGSQRVIA